MRIECDNCSAQYNIADEKVAGKMLKVRCKKCGNMIPVDGRGVGQASAAPTEEATRIVDVGGSGGGLPEWFIVVEGDQQGPFTSTDLQRRFEAGQLAADTFVWKDGMADWDALSAIPAFAPWTAPPEDDYGDESTRVVASHDEMPASSGVGQVASFPTGALSSIAPPESSKGAFAGAAAAETGRDAFFSTQRQSAVGSEPEAPTSSLVGARNESSVLFSLDSLASSRSSRKEDVPRTEESGLINLQGLIDTRKATAADDEVGVDAAAPVGGAAASGDARKPVPMPTAAIPALPPQKKSNALVLVAIAALVVIVLLGGVIIWLLLQPATPEPQPVATPEPAVESAAVAAVETPEREPEPAPVVAEAAEEEEGGDEEEVAEAEATEEESDAAAAAAAARPSPARQQQAERAAAPAPTPSSATETRTPPTSVAVSPPSRPSPTPTREPEPAARPSPSAAPSGGGASDDRVASVLESIRGGGESARPSAPQQAAQPALPQTLQRDDVQATIRRYQARVARCRSEGGDAQRYLANFVIQPSGSVTNVSVDPSDDVGTCLAGVVRDFQFPRFGGDPMPVQYPFRL